MLFGDEDVEGDGLVTVADSEPELPLPVMAVGRDEVIDTEPLDV